MRETLSTTIIALIAVIFAVTAWVWVALQSDPDIPVVTFVPIAAVEPIKAESRLTGELPSCDDLPRPVVGEPAGAVACELSR